MLEATHNCARKYSSLAKSLLTRAIHADREFIMSYFTGEEAGDRQSSLYHQNHSMNRRRDQNLNIDYLLKACVLLHYTQTPSVPGTMSYLARLAVGCGDLLGEKGNSVIVRVSPRYPFSHPHTKLSLKVRGKPTAKLWPCVLDSRNQ